MNTVEKARILQDRNRAAFVRSPLFRPTIKLVEVPVQLPPSPNPKVTGIP